MIRTALIGCGRIADRHVRLLTSMPEFRLEAVSDIHPEKGERLAESHGARAYSSY